MSNNEQVYLNLLRDILDNGAKREDRTGVGTIGVFGRQLRFDLRDRFPLITTKKIIWEMVTSELIWFLEGSSDERRLAEIRYGKPRDELVSKKTIWTANAEAPYWKPKAEFDGDLGRVYGKQLREWQVPVWAGPHKQGMSIESIDQIQILIDGIKKDPYGRRHILTMWNPGELDQMALPPCHMMSQFYVSDGELSCQLYQRSADALLGIPVNIASYALLTMMIAQVCNLKAGEFIHTFGDAHIYLSHLDQVEEQLSREPKPAPSVKLNPEVTSIDDFTMDDFELIGYVSHPSIKAEMAV